MEDIPAAAVVEKVMMVDGYRTALVDSSCLVAFLYLVIHTLAVVADKVAVGSVERLGHTLAFPVVEAYTVVKVVDKVVA